MAQQTTDHDIQRLRAAVDLPALIAADVPLKRNGKGMVACCPFHDERTPSFHVYADHYHCFGCGAHGDVFDWLNHRRKMPLREAVAFLAGTPAPAPKAARAEDWQPITPVPNDAPAADHNGAALVHEYRDASGALLFYMRRHNNGARKTFSPLVYGVRDGRTGWHQKSVPAPRPLYGLDRLARLLSNPIITEGEKAADAAQRLFPAHPCLTWPNGTSSADKADWSPLAGRDVILWPDNDPAGASAINAITAILHDIGATVRLVRVDDLPPKADAADVTPDDPAAWLVARLYDAPVPGDDAPPPASEDDYGAIGNVVGLDGKPVETPPKKKQQGVPIEMFADIAPALETNDLVEGVLGAGAMSVIYGESNSGKTFFILDAALHKACGWPWRERHLDQGGVIYCCLEGAHGIRNRVAAFKIEHGLEGKDIPFGIVTVPLNLCQTEDDANALIAAVQAKEKELGFTASWVVMDTLARAMAGGNENAPDDMGALVSNGDKIREALKCHLSWVHHSGKDQARGARGHSSLRAATDTEIEVINAEGQRVARVTKQREYDCNGEFGFKLKVIEIGANQRGKPVSSCVVEPAEAVAATGGTKRYKPSKNGEMGLRALHLALDKSGAYLPALPEYPDRTFAASASIWRDEFYQLKGGEMSHKRTYFSRAETELIGAGIITQRNGFVWVVKQKKGGE